MANCSFKKFFPYDLKLSRSTIHLLQAVRQTDDNHANSSTVT